MQFFFSNQTEALYHDLKAQLFACSHPPFSRRLIAVPSPAMKSWLTMLMAQDPEIGIATGFEICHLDNLFQKLQDVTILDAPLKQLNPFELSLAIECEIRTLVAARETFSINETNIWQPLFDYLKIPPHATTIPQKGDRRLAGLSDLLNDLFVKYGKYGKDLLSQWESEEQEQWQPLLWKRIYSRWDSSYSFIDRIKKQPKPSFSRTDVQIHLFAISHLPNLFHQFFTNLSKHLPISYYLLSPCLQFWSDLLTDFESKRMRTFLKHQKVPENQLRDLQGYLSDNNPLLANFGKLGREMVKLVEETPSITKEQYLLPKSVLDYPEYENLLFDNVDYFCSNEPLTLLQAIQTDLLLLRKPSKEKIVLSQEDDSLQMHRAATTMREVQILQDILIKALQKMSSGNHAVSPSNILVMTPDIQKYAPHIDAVFNDPESSLKAQIFDLSTQTQNPLVKAFLHLVELSSGRWDANSILKLFDFPHFQKQHQLNMEELQQIRKWVQQADIRWGVNAGHRDAFLQKNHCRHGMVENAPQGTWEEALERLLYGMAMTASSSHDISPIETEFTQTNLLGKWIEIMRSLYKDLARLNDDTKRSLGDWSSYLTTILKAYFVPSDDAGKEGHTALTQCFEKLRLAEHKLGKTLLPFSTVLHHLQRILNRGIESYEEDDLNKVRFCAMLPMRAIPADIIVLMGMDEGDYPRHENVSSLNLLASSKTSDYCPSQVDYDRFLFLEAILSTRKKLIITYCGSSREDGKTKPPSLLVTELLSYLDNGYLMEGTKPSEHCVYEHPFHPFDKQYFSPNSKIYTFSKNHYSAAKAFYNVDKKTPSNFVSSFEIIPQQLANVVPTLSLSIKDLSAMAKNPIKAFFNKSLGIYLNKAEDKILKNEEEFLVSHMQSFLFKKAAFKNPVDELLGKAIKSGSFPMGPFKQLSIEKVMTDIGQLKEQLSTHNIAPESIFQIHLSDHFQQPEQSENGSWNLPPLCVEYNQTKIQIVGTLQEVCASGLIVRGKDEKGELAKVWPEFLIYMAVIKAHRIPCNPDLIFLNGKKSAIKEAFFESPDCLLTDYLEYYFAALQHVSPLIPEWIPHLITDEGKDFEEKMVQSLTNPFQPLYNDYLHWGVKNALLCDPQAIVEAWRPRATKLFQAVYEQWW